MPPLFSFSTWVSEYLSPGQLSSLLLGRYWSEVRPIQIQLHPVRGLWRRGKHRRTVFLGGEHLPVHAHNYGTHPADRTILELAVCAYADEGIELALPFLHRAAISAYTLLQ